MSSTPDTQGPPLVNYYAGTFIVNASDIEQSIPGGPPYPPPNAGLGGTPSPVPDIPISITFLLLYLILGITHIKIFKANKVRGHKFVFNGALLGQLISTVNALKITIADVTRSL